MAMSTGRRSPLTERQALYAAVLVLAFRVFLSDLHAALIGHVWSWLTAAAEIGLVVMLLLTWGRGEHVRLVRHRADPTAPTLQVVPETADA